MEFEFTVDVSAADFFAANAKLFRMGWAPQKVAFAYLSSLFLLTVVAMAAVGPSDAGTLADLRAQLPLGAGIAAVVLATLRRLLAAIAEFEQPAICPHRNDGTAHNLSPHARSV